MVSGTSSGRAWSSPIHHNNYNCSSRLVDAYDRGLDNPLTSIERAALPLALARQPLWWVGRWLPVLDNEEEARQGLAEMSRDLEWALEVIREADRWQAAFA